VVKSKKKRAAEILERLQMDYPDAGTMLKYANTFELLVAVVLSAQSTDAQVNKVTADLFARYNTPEQLAAIEIGELEGLIRGVGLYKNKARSIKHLSQVLLDKFEGKVPGDLGSLLELPGVGRKTANVMLSVGFALPGLGIDTHVQRVSKRLGLTDEKNPDKIEKALKDIIPISQWSRAHHLFIFHGRKICTARKPKCSQCNIEKDCQKVLDN